MVGAGNVGATCAQVRPCKTYPGVRTRFEDVDLIIIRENTEDLYAGIEYEQGTEDAEELISWIESKGGRLRHLEERDAADRLERAIAAVIDEGKSVTYDMKPRRDDPTSVGTSQVADAIIEKLEAGVPA